VVAVDSYIRSSQVRRGCWYVMRVSQFRIVLINVLVFNEIGDPSFILGGWAIAEFKVRVGFDGLDSWSFLFDGSNRSSLLIRI
jgi:hypothetical protein